MDVYCVFHYQKLSPRWPNRASLFSQSHLVACSSVSKTDWWLSSLPTPLAWIWSWLWRVTDDISPAAPGAWRGYSRSFCPCTPPRVKVVSNMITCLVALEKITMVWQGLVFFSHLDCTDGKSGKKMLLSIIIIFFWLSVFYCDKTLAFEQLSTLAWKSITSTSSLLYLPSFLSATGCYLLEQPPGQAPQANRYVSVLLGCSWLPLTWPVNVANWSLAWGKQGEMVLKGRKWAQYKGGWEGDGGCVGREMKWETERRVREGGAPGSGPWSSVDILSHL